MICLDTNAVIAIVSGRVRAVRDHVEVALNAGEVLALPAMVMHEMWYGIAKSDRRPASIALFETFMGRGVVFLPFDEDDCREAGEIRAQLAKVGTPIGPYDVLIAAQARRRGATLVTANVREFMRVPGLNVADWSSDGPLG